MHIVMLRFLHILILIASCHLSVGNVQEAWAVCRQLWWPHFGSRVPEDGVLRRVCQRPYYQLLWRPVSTESKTWSISHEEDSRGEWHETRWVWFRLLLLASRKLHTWWWQIVTEFCFSFVVLQVGRNVTQVSRVNCLICKRYLLLVQQGSSRKSLWDFI
jgi:hypothetical protein